MSIHLICDSCRKIIYDEDNKVSLEATVTNRYYKNDQHKYLLYLCEGCDMKLAQALLPIIPSLAYSIEPNANIEDTLLTKK